MKYYETTKKCDCKFTYKRISKIKNTVADFFWSFSNACSTEFRFHLQYPPLQYSSSLQHHVGSNSQSSPSYWASRIWDNYTFECSSFNLLYKSLYTSVIYYFRSHEIDVAGRHNYYHWLKISWSLLVLYMPELHRIGGYFAFVYLLL